MEGHEVRQMAAIEERHWWFRERRELLDQRIKDLTPGIALDIGAAGGGNTAVLTARAWQVAAVEYGSDGAELAAERGLDVIRGDATALPFGDGVADLVVAYDVLEHIEDDEAAAREMLRVLRPGGRALVAVPVDMSLWSEHDEAVGHVRRYSRESMTALLSNAGFVIDDVMSWMVLLRPVLALRRRVQRGSDLGAPNPLVNTALRAVVTLERSLPVRDKSGVSVFVTAHRPAE